MLEHILGNKAQSMEPGLSLASSRPVGPPWHDNAEVTMNSLRAGCWVAALLLTACGSTQSDWNEASAVNTVAAYESFIDKHPNTPQSMQAHQQIATLNDEQAWA